MSDVCAVICFTWHCKQIKLGFYYSNLEQLVFIQLTITSIFVIPRSSETNTHFSYNQPSR